MSKKTPASKTIPVKEPEIEEKKPLNEKINNQNQFAQNQQYDIKTNENNGFPPESVHDEFRKNSIQPIEAEEIPTDKDSLIHYLKNKLYQTQMTIEEAFQVFHDQKDLTAKLAFEFEIKRKEFHKIQKATNKPLREKVHENIEKTLEKAIQEKVEAENKRNFLKSVLKEKKMMKKELTSTLKLLQIENTSKEAELNHLTNRVNEFDQLIAELRDNKAQNENESLEKDNEIQRLLRERDDMRGVMRKLTDVRNVLNRLLSNPEILYTRERTLEYLAKDLIPIKNNQSINQIHQDIPSSKQFQPQLNKPNYLVNEDDFWYADPTKEVYAKDYGGRENNYNEKYYYNSKAQNEINGGESSQLNYPKKLLPPTILPGISTNKPQGFKNNISGDQELNGSKGII